ncbi:uncharacterized protein [Haliotis asinina]|uniref:uncharacterized protein n=1 Tax=Haliotis asinina TaxID=109174 RepID=UPI003531BA76
MKLFNSTVKIKTKYLFTFAVCMIIWQVLHLLSCSRFRSAFSSNVLIDLRGSDHKSALKFIKDNTDIVDDTTNEEDSLEAMFAKRLTRERQTDIPEVKVTRASNCREGLNPEYPCIDTNCTGQVKSVNDTNLREFIDSQYRVPEVYIDAIFSMRKRTHHHKVVLVSATSDNHFMESLVFLKNVQEIMFPAMSNIDFHFVMYDLGMTSEQRANMENLCQCEVRDFPFESFPKRLRRLKCYIWKPIIISANLPVSDILLWADASTRFTNTNMMPLLKQIKASGVMMSKIIRALGQHFAPKMMEYYGERSCHFSPYWEFEANFIGLANDRFVREAIVAPWVSCAFAPDCMCPEGSHKMLKCNVKVRGYNKCHRFDQSSLNIILIKLFQDNMQKMTMPKSLFHDIKRGDRLDKYVDMKLA